MITINFYLNNKKELNDFVNHIHCYYPMDFSEEEIVVDGNKVTVEFGNHDDEFEKIEEENLGIWCEEIELVKEVEVLEFVSSVNDEIENIEYSNEIIEIVDEVEVEVKTESKENQNDWYWVLIKDWFYFKANKQFSNRMIAAWPDYDPNDCTRNIKEDMHEVDGACLKLAETEKAIKFRVPTEYFSGSCSRDWDMWFPKSVVKYGQNP